MPRSIWRGAISFGLVNVPVKLYSAVSKKTVRFNQLHDKDGQRIQQKRVCSVDGEEVPFENIVKGYEISPDRYVVITPEELEAIDPKKTRSIDIEDFVDLDEIDPLFYEHPYYLVPDTGASKAYNLLLTALEETNKVAIARVVIRSKEYLTAIRPANGVLTMETMLFADELVSPDTIDELPEDDVHATEREVAMARQLIDSLATEFDPTKYRDEYRERVLDLIERKAEGQEIVVEEVSEAPTKAPDLMAALEASLAEAKGQPASGNGKPATKKRTTARKSPSKSSSSKSNSPKSSGSKPRSSKPAAKRKQKAKA
jgi:DNA end-binding protein Ku